jgi:hypothetical protein
MNNEFLNSGSKDMEGEQTGATPNIKYEKEDKNIASDNETIGREAVNDIEKKVNDVNEWPKENERVFQGGDGKENMMKVKERPGEKQTQLKTMKGKLTNTYPWKKENEREMLKETQH